MPQYHDNIWPQFSNDRFYDTALGDEQVILGFYVIKDYYSPEFPDGNLELFPQDSALLRITISTDTHQLNPKEDFDVVMR